jgi:acyl carrier protein
MLDEFKNFLDEELGIDDDITPDTNLRDDLMIDSLATTQLVLSLEEKYNIKVEQNELAGLKTVKDCLDLLKKKGIESVN